MNDFLRTQATLLVILGYIAAIGLIVGAMGLFLLWVFSR